MRDNKKITDNSYYDNFLGEFVFTAGAVLSLVILKKTEVFKFEFVKA